MVYFTDYDKEHPINQTLNTVKETVLQIFRFYKPQKKYVVCHFLKDPKSPKSKTRLRKDLTDDFVNELGRHGERFRRCWHCVLF